MLIPLCTADPLVGMLHDMFGTHIVRVPDGRIQPLCLLLHSGGRVHFRGTLAAILHGNGALAVPLTNSPVASLSGKRSRRVTLDLGLFFLQGILQALGVSSAGVAATLHGVGSMAFAFPAIQRSAADIGVLGRALQGRRVDLANPAAAPFGDAGGEALLIDSVLSSTGITISLAATHEGSIRIDAPGLEQLVAGSTARVEVAVAPEQQITIQSDAPLPFAFSCVRLVLDAEGRVVSLPPDEGPRVLGAAAHAQLTSSVFGSGPMLVLWDS